MMANRSLTRPKWWKHKEMESNVEKKMKDQLSLVVISQWGSDVKGINGGNVKKLFSQIEAFKRSGFDVRTVIKEPPARTGKASIFDRLMTKAKNILPFCTNQCIIRYSEVGKADCYFVRFRAYDYPFRKLITKIRKENPEAKVVFEYSDYPYYTLRGRDVIGDALVKFRDDYNRDRTLKCVDRIATLRSDKEMDGKPCLKMFNGLDVEKIKRKTRNHIPGEIHVLIVASLQPAHGVDRFIEGMKEYYRGEWTEKVILHIVGGGSILDEIKAKAEDLGDKVIFHGFMFGEELDAMYDKCDIGLEIMAPKRKDIIISASLKSREYIARGFPFVSACKLDISDLGFEDYCRVPDTEAPIDIKGIIEYYSSYEENYEANADSMRKFAEKYLDMEFAMKEIIDYFKDNSVHLKED